MMITRILFESLGLLIVVWIVVQFGLIALWSWRRTRVCARIVWIGFATLPALATVSVLVVTDRESVITLCHDLASYVQEGNTTAIELRLASSFEAEDLDREAFIARLEQTLTRYRADGVVVSRFEVDFPDRDVSVAEFHARCQIRSPDFPYEMLLSRWRLTFRRHANEWKVTNLRPLCTPQLDLRNLHDWLR